LQQAVVVAGGAVSEAWQASRGPAGGKHVAGGAATCPPSEPTAYCKSTIALEGG